MKEILNPDTFYATQGLPFIIMFISTVVLEQGNSSAVNAIGGTILIWYWIYFIHWFHHMIPSTGIFAFLNPHVSIHHAEVKTMPRALELFIETLENIWWFVILLLLQKATGIEVVPIYVFLFITLLYTSVHIINYSILGLSQKHKDQHAMPNKNLAPDTLDHMFGTNSDDEVEDQNNTIPNMIICFLMVYAIKHHVTA
jgi:hypothetical protein